jgi:hypothetical protein
MPDNIPPPWLPVSAAYEQVRELEVRVADLETALRRSRSWADAEARRADVAERTLRETIRRLGDWRRGEP